MSGRVNPGPFIVNDQDYIIPEKSIFNKIVGDSHLELEFAAFLDKCEDIISFVKNSRSTHFRIEYKTADGGIAPYYPDFIVKDAENDIWIIETKGREDLDDPRKWQRLCQWCVDASDKNPSLHFRPLFVRQEKWNQYRPKTLKDLCAGFAVPET